MKKLNRTVVQLAHELATKKISALELAQDYLQQIKAQPELNAMLDVQPETTLDQARAADAELQVQGHAGSRKPLLGVPIAHKDIFVTRDFDTTAGSKMLEKYRSPFDAHVVEKCAQAGMVTLGKTNCDEFAMGSTNENSYYGAVKNPRDLAAIPGGSSGGAAAAVAAGLAPCATGTDTGGSIRQPAAMCGITGIKPSYGRVSRYGMVAFASSLDQGGPMAHTAEDCALLLNAMAGFDTRDSTCLNLPEEDFSRLLNQAPADSHKPLKGLRIGLPHEFFADGVNAGVLKAVQNALAEYEKLGASLVEISLPKTELTIPVYYVLAPAEASSNLSRFDGVRYGYRAPDYKDLTDMYQKTRAQGFGAEVKRRIMVGSYVLSHGYYDAYYLQAQKLRRMIAEDFQSAFTQCDVIAGPVTPTVAWNLGAKTDDPVANYLSDIFTLGASLAGLPGMSLPCGTAPDAATQAIRPVGLQLIGNYFEEAQLLNVAHRYQVHILN